LSTDGGRGSISATLSRFTRDLTADARAGLLEPVRCRDEEVARVIDILLRHGKNNPTLVGPAGVGKTAIAEGLAQRIAAGRVPFSLRAVRLLSLDHVALLAGTTYRGQYEERIRVIVADTSAAGDVILFIDELHNLIGQGTAMGAAMDAANMLKPALVRGDFRVIGATTGDEYSKWIEGDPALERRFQKVTVHELGERETLEIIEARKERLERHHNVLITDDAIRAAVRLTDQHVRDRMRPDKALDALDEACAHTQAVTEYTPAAEDLIKQRTALLRAESRKAQSQNGAARPRREKPVAMNDENGEPPPPEYDPEDDPIERTARKGFSALERFGAELEAMFIGDMPAVRADAAPSSDVAPPPAETKLVTLGEIEAALSHQLMHDGVVVRGHDVARVVGLMAGITVPWEEPA
jgi:ATP-dependent Clp protease ATP-binding subunit ClpA